MYSLLIILEDGKHHDMKEISEVNITNTSDSSVKTIKGNEFSVFVPWTNNYYSFISEKEIFTTHGKNIKALNFYKRDN